MVALTRHSLAARAATVVQAYCGYLWKMAVPFNLAPIYPLARSVNYPIVIACTVALLIMTFLFLWVGRARRYLAVGWLWYLGMLIPVIGIVHVGMQSMADRYTYLPLVGIFILAAWSAAEAIAHCPWLKRPLAGLTVAALVVCCLLTSAQVRLWASTETLFTHTAAVTGENSVALTNLGLVAIQKEDYAEAERRLREALRIDPASIDARGNLATMFVKQKKYDAALKLYAEINQLSPNNPKAFGQAANAFNLKGDQQGVEACLRRAVELEPASIAFRRRLAEVQQMLGKTQDALDNYAIFLWLSPGERGALNNIAWIYATHPKNEFRDGAKAIELLQPLAAKPDNAPEFSNLLDSLAAAYAEAGRFDDALQTIETAIDKAREPGQIARNDRRLPTAGRPL